MKNFLISLKKTKPARKRFKIDSKTWEQDFRVILAQEGFSYAEAAKAVKFAKNFRGFERAKYKIAQDHGFDGSIRDYKSGWEKVFAQVMGMGAYTLRLKPKTLAYLSSIRSLKITNNFEQF